MTFDRFKQIWDSVFSNYVPPKSPEITDTCSREVMEVLTQIADAQSKEEIDKIMKKVRAALESEVHIALDFDRTLATFDHGDVLHVVS